ncbi:alkaline protease secretion protein AprE [Shimia sp. NS0008-38b]|uniref:HlyD family efflux transporter periplasmic adaptor subunit n=1 Tax=Shimia sp. NS0008-38b TaxID=3127653 RepID=UPI003107AF8F
MSAVDTSFALNGSSPGLPPHLLHPLYVGFGIVAVALLGFVVWAATVPLATSIPTLGHLNAARPSYDVQHAFGGKIAEVFVKEHEHVAAGQRLLLLDVAQEREELATLHATLAPLTEERAALRAALRDQLPSEGQGPETAPGADLAVRRLRNMQAAMQLRANMSSDLQASLELRTQSLEQSAVRRRQQLASMKDRHTRYAGLLARGAFRAADADALAEDILELEAALQRVHSELVSLRSQAAQAEMQITREQLEFRQGLLDRLAQLGETIPKLQLQILRLEALVAHAEVRAPDAGVIAALPFDTKTMIIPRGETVLTLARPEGRHHVSFVTSPQSIDQLRVGMRGHLTVTALSQRDHPRVNVTIQSLSPEARRNPEGDIVGYDGVSQIDPADYADLLAQLGEHGSLSTDMPVSLVFSGRTITFGDYLIGPFLDFLKKAMQD